jgi:fructose-bisphosphate aldolase class I
MLEKISAADGFIAALDQSGGSTPRALQLYGYPSSDYQVGEDSMFDAVHEMRSRIMTSPTISGDRVLGAILFEDTMTRMVEAQPTAEYLWSNKQIIPFLKVDKGLEEEQNGVQLMKPMPNLQSLLKKAKNEYGIFGTKMRSLIKSHNPKGIREIVEQQFQIAKQIIHAGLVPILEPEVDISSSDKAECEYTLKDCLLEHLDSLGAEEKIILKLSLPEKEDFYMECMKHPNCLRVVALSGGYTQENANARLAHQKQMIASFSRALTEGLQHRMSQENFDRVLDNSIDSIFAASRA